MTRSPDNSSALSASTSIAAPDAPAQALHTSPVKNRLERVDIARGLALVAMAIYHFGWDLEFFGYLAPGTASLGWWRVFARCIASSFLFLVGFSLVLAHYQSIRWQPFFKRLAQVVAAAAAITLLTYIYMPGNFIFFGILHQIALASLLGLVFLRAPLVLIALLAIFTISAPYFARSEIFDHPALWWVGLSTVNPVSNDYVPLFPWFGAVLAGIAIARLMQSQQWLGLLRGTFKPQWLNDGLIKIGRHSLIFYLLHQPVLIGIVFVATLVFPPSTNFQAEAFRNQCTAQCSSDNDAVFCSLYCDCVLQGINSNNLNGLLSGKDTSTLSQIKINELAKLCAADPAQLQP